MMCNILFGDKVAPLDRWNALYLLLHNRGFLAWYVFYISSHTDADPEFFFKIKLDEEAKGLTNRPLTLTVRVNQPGAKVKWTYKGKDLDVSHDIII